MGCGASRNRTDAVTTSPQPAPMTEKGATLGGAPAVEPVQTAVQDAKAPTDQPPSGGQVEQTELQQSAAEAPAGAAAPAEGNLTKAGSKVAINKSQASLPNKNAAPTKSNVSLAKAEGPKGSTAKLVNKSTRSLAGQDTRPKDKDNLLNTALIRAAQEAEQPETEQEQAGPTDPAPAPAEAPKAGSLAGSRNNISQSTRSLKEAAGFQSSQNKLNETHKSTRSLAQQPVAEAPAVDAAPAPAQSHHSLAQSNHAAASHHSLAKNTEVTKSKNSVAGAGFAAEQPAETGNVNN